MTITAKTFHLAIILIACFGIVQFAISETVVTTGSELKFIDCHYPYPLKKKIRCAQLITDAKFGQFSLPVVILKAKNNRKKEAIIYIPGGPGEGFQVTKESIEYWLEWMDEANLSRDLVLFDPRGVGESQPSWQCEQYDFISRQILAEDLAIELELKKTNPVLNQCLNDFNLWVNNNVKVTGNIHPGLSIYSSYNQARDISDLVEKLDYRAVHLWGISYGTRVAMLAAHSPKIKTIILDSPYLLNKGKIIEWPFLLNQALQFHNKIYSQLYAKVGRHSDFFSLWSSVVSKLDSQSQSFTMQNQVEDNKSYPLVITSDRLASIMYFILYDVSLWYPFYEALEYLESPEQNHKIQENLEKFESWELILQSFIEWNFDEQFNSIIFYTVECLDNPLSDQSDFELELKKYPAIARFAQFDWQYDICRQPLFKNRIPVENFKLVKKPTLILSGQFDPVTPLQWGQELQQQLGSSGYYYGIPGASHGVTVNGICEAGVIEAFIKNPASNLKKLCPDVNLIWP